MDAKRLNTERATIEEACLFRVQTPADNVPQLLKAITDVAPLRYGNYEQVAFRCRKGIQQYKPLTGSKMGAAELTHIPCDEISFTVPRQDEIITAVIDVIFENHPHEEPVILIQEIMCTRFKYGKIKDAPGKRGFLENG